MKIKILTILFFLTVLTGCKTTSVERQANFDDYFVDYQQDRLLSGVDALPLDEYEIKFEGAKMREVVDSLNKLSDDFTVYLAVQGQQFDSASGALNNAVGGSLGSSVGVSSAVGVSSNLTSYRPSGSSSGSSSGSKSLDDPSNNAEIMGNFNDKMSVVAGNLTGFGSARASSPINEIEITGLFTGRIDEIVRDISQQAGLDWEVFGNKYYIGGSLSDYMITASVESALDSSSISRIAGLYGVVIVKTSDKCVITGRCKRVRAAYDLLLETSENPQSYNVDLVLVDVSESKLADLRAKIEVSNIDLIQEHINLWDIFEATGNFELSDSRSYNYIDQELYCSDGKQVSLAIGSEVQREQRAISDAGTSTVSGYKTNNDGLTLNLKPIRSVDGVVNMSLTYEDSSFQDDDLAKTTTSLNYSGVSLELGKLYYLTCVEQKTSGKKFEFFGVKKSNERKLTTIWLCVRPATPRKNYRGRLNEK